MLLGGRASLTLPLVDRERVGRAADASGYAFWLLGLFAVSIGLPFFALAANNPLLQAWFVRTGHPNGPDPYFLYASSNIGSFLALLSYPVSAGADVHAAHAEPDLDRRLRPADRADRNLRRAAAALAEARRSSNMRGPTIATRRRRPATARGAGYSLPPCRRAC